MRERRVGVVPVTEADNRLLGIFTGCDAVHRVLAEGKSAARTKLAEVMTPEPDTMPPAKTAIEALRLMEHGRYRHMPVVDGGRVVGIILEFCTNRLRELREPNRVSTASGSSTACATTAKPFCASRLRYSALSRLA
jgi:signal-transduction protein with cAMP-binding, CBS, and nucleotidyltransferase domain